MELEKEYLAETAERINQYSRVNAFRWSEEALLNVLDTKIRTPIGWSKQLWPKSNLSRLRFYELDSELKKAGLDLFAHSVFIRFFCKYGYEFR